MAVSRGERDSNAIISAIVRGLNPADLVRESITFHDSELTFSSLPDPARVNGEIKVLAIGKSAVPMAAGAMDALGERVSAALAVTKQGSSIPDELPGQLDILTADHPVPAESSIQAGRRVLQFVDDLGQNDLVVMLISGGGSALVESLGEGVSLDDLQCTTDELLQAGATINHLNAVRRRISNIKGGKLARAIAPARVVNLIVSDVLGSPLQDIASGPTVEPVADDRHLRELLRRDDWLQRMPASVRDRLSVDVDVQEARWEGPVNILGSAVLADARNAAHVAEDAAREAGYRVESLGYDFQGEAADFGRALATIARHYARERQDELPIALICSGELTVTVHGNGRGGRNTEAALAAAIDIDGWPEITLTCFATDGDDGLSGFAGGSVTGRTAGLLREQGIDPADRLRENDSAGAIHAAGAAIDLGPTGTNVNDVYFALIAPPAD